MFQYFAVPLRWLKRPSMTATGLMCRIYLGGNSNDDALIRGAKYLTEDFLNDRTKTGTDIKLIRSKAKEKGEDLDKAFYEEMQACDARSIFRDEDNPEDEDPTEELEDYGE